MSLSLSDFRLVSPRSDSFSAAEIRIGKVGIRLNNLAAAELGYSDYVRLLIGDSLAILGVQPCEGNDPYACPFMVGKTANDLRGQKKWISIKNRMLATILRSKMHCENEKGVKRVYGSKWREENALLFDLTKPVELGKRSAPVTAEEILRSYELAAPAKGGQIVAIGISSQFRPVPSEPVNQVIDADYVVM